MEPDLAEGLSTLEQVGIFAGIATAALFVGVLVAQIVATNKAAKAANAARDAANAAVRSAELASEEAGIKLRPWIGIGAPDVLQIEKDKQILKAKTTDSDYLKFTDNDLPEGSVLVHTILITNYGDFPASRVGIGSGQSFEMEEAVKNMKTDSGLSNSVVFPTQVMRHSFEIPRDDYVRSQGKNGPRYFIAFSVTYSDRIGNLWVTEGVWTLVGNNITVIRQDIGIRYELKQQ